MVRLPPLGKLRSYRNGVAVAHVPHYIGSSAQSVVVSVDDGQTWVELDAWTANAFQNYCPMWDGDQVYLLTTATDASINDGMWRSTDGGATWNRESSTGSFNDYTAQTIRCEFGYYAFNAFWTLIEDTFLEQYLLIKSVDNGITWSTFTSQTDEFGFAVSPEGVFLLNVGNGTPASSAQISRDADGSTAASFTDVLNLGGSYSVETAGQQAGNVNFDHYADIGALLVGLTANIGFPTPTPTTAIYYSDDQGASWAESKFTPNFSASASGGGSWYDDYIFRYDGEKMLLIWQSDDIHDPDNGGSLSNPYIHASLDGKLFSSYDAANYVGSQRTYELVPQA